MNDNAAESRPYIAHIRASDGNIQTVSDHLQAVQTGCEAYGAKIGIAHLAGMAGLLHDLGKNTTSFQEYIHDAAAHPDHPPRRGSIDHSTAGGRFLYRHYHKDTTDVYDKVAVEWMANCIISHHQGLRDFLSPELDSPFFERVALKSKGMEEYEEAEAAFLTERTLEEVDHYFALALQETKNVLDTIRAHEPKAKAITSALLIKYLFSCLIDADRTDARQFEEDQKESWMRSYRDFFQRSYINLLNEMHRFEESEDANHPINQLRRNMSQQCDDFAIKPPGIYTLSIPTGGGKTLSSLRYALKHALYHDMERIIYIAPYTTIIEQNANEVRRILQENDLILEHHSNIIEDIDYDENDYDLTKKRLTLARNNWDRPVIFTTMVQFLNTFYAKGTTNIRRLHRLSHAVLIFDEVQAVPSKCVSLFNASLNFLDAFGSSTAILCTATQPTLDFVKNKLRLSKGAEIISNMNQVSQQFKRVEIEDLSASPLGAEGLAAFIEERMQEVQQILIILNTKSAVRKLFVQLQQAPWTKDNGVTLFHLSTSMCAAHRREILKEMKGLLKQNMPVICVSTQLIEAGVDISFQTVIRSLAGLDSIAQAAGRCNRHGKDPIRKVYVIKSSDEILKNLPEIQVAADITQRVFHEFAHDLLSSDAMTTYFKYYFHAIKDTLDYPISDSDSSLYELLSTNANVFAAYGHRHGHVPEIVSRPSFATAANHFAAIQDASIAVLVPFNEEAQNILVKLNGELEGEDLDALLTQSQQYVVNLYEHEVHALDRNGDIYSLLHKHVLALRDTAYSQHLGVAIEDSVPWRTEFG